MSLKDIAIKMEYRSLIDNVAKEFYIPMLKEAISYKRAVGFFSSSSLVEISKGISGLVKNGGTIKLVASPNLSEEDIEAIRKGYLDREEIIKGALIRELEKPVNDYQGDRLNYLANLITDGILDIKIAVTEADNKFGMYHEKVGIVSDAEGNTVAFSGSMNESANAFMSNYETIDVFKSWTSDSERVQKKEESFDQIWKNIEQGIRVYEFEDITDQFIEKYKKEKVDYDHYDASRDEIPQIDKELHFFREPDDIDFYEYQKEAMAEWVKRGCCGIYNMATGTGKTYTALGSICKLSLLLDEKLAVVIVVPYIHLVEQWIEDIDRFGVKPIVAYGYSGNHWRDEFKDAVSAYNLGAIDNFCIITTNATFEGNDFQEILKRFRKNFMFLADEAHNLGAEKIRKALPTKARYRLALSATLDRHRDQVGTEALRQFFGKECISFGLDKAIKNGFLTSYYYYPIVVHLDDDELERYKEITKLIRKNVPLAENSERTKKYVEMLLIKRARIVAGCRSKIDRLVEEIKPFSKDNHILVYCGATKYDRDDISDDDDIRQIDEVNRRLSEEYGMRVRKFTSSEKIDERQEIKEMFVNESIQVITAIKCLDEGVNIPAINKAYILASSTNPKEYIQRRGRVLRKAEGKKFATIYDFITLPRPLEDVHYLSNEEKELEKDLVYREFVRMQDFADSARNPADSDTIHSEIQQAYRLEHVKWEDIDNE